MGAVRRFYTHHDDASGLLYCTHAHDGGHADGGALEVNPAAKDRGQEVKTLLGEKYLNLQDYKSISNKLEACRLSYKVSNSLD